MATAAYPFLGKLDAQTFARLLGAGELTLGASLLLPIVPTALAGLGLAGFSAGRVGSDRGAPVTGRAGHWL